MIQCISCGKKFSIPTFKSVCDKCNGSLEYLITLPIKKDFSAPENTKFWKYRSFFPTIKNKITLGEGCTSLHKTERLGKNIGIKDVYLKDETQNPTHSYRDRAAALLTSHAIDLGYKVLVCATNGNMGASLAAYCAKAGLVCHAIVPKVVDLGKLAQMIAYDAIIDDYGDIVDYSISQADILAKESGWYQATAELNPLVIEAQKTISYEIYSEIGIPDYVLVSMGSGGTIYSLWKGFVELKNAGFTTTLPHLIGIQHEGCSPIVDLFYGKNSQHAKIFNPDTRASAILVAKPVQSDLAIKAINESKGLALTVSDSEILSAELQIAKMEGVFAEPASSATVAALNKLTKEKKIHKNDKVVALITGSGLKATDVLQALNKKQKTAGFGLELSTKEKILRLISRKDSYGYDIWKELGRIITRAAVYQHLNELFEKGLIFSYEKENKKFFKLTKRGKKALDAFDDLKILF